LSWALALVGEASSHEITSRFRALRQKNCLLSIVILDIEEALCISLRRESCHEEVKMTGLLFKFEGSVCSLL
tara:strand:- start:480 stop:695 length:216 start_codon:yes stop_codon:yes gene_type:complete